jgi:2-dehydropantoate 2-reductase
MFSPSKPIVILGAGAIGCYVGAHWARAGLPVVLLGRAHLHRLAQTGLIASRGVNLPPQAFALSPQIADHPSILQNASLIVVTVKSTALGTAIGEIEHYANPETPILCLLNGLSAVRDLRAAFPNRAIAAGMVPFNVVWQSENTLQRSSVGDVVAQAMPVTEMLTARLQTCGEPLRLSTDITAVQHGKLLLNLNNPINALSGLSLYAQLRQRPYRLAYAAILHEAISILNTAKIAHAKSGPLPAKAIVQMLRAPNWLFNTVALRLQKLDPTSQTSMAQDLAAGKPTEIDTINGEIQKIAAETGQTAPINNALIQLVKQAQSGGRQTFSGDQLLGAITR